MPDQATPVAASAAVPLPVLRIQPSRGWVALNLRELSHYRDLLYFLAWRDIKVRYKQTLIGAAWAILQPLLTMLIFSLFLGRLAKVPSDNIPYPVFSYAALVLWGFFAHGLTESANSLVGGADLLRKVYFPRLVIPLAAVIGGLIDFLIALLVLLPLMLTYGLVPTVTLLWLPLFILLTLIAALGAGLWLSAVNVQFRDVRYAIPFLIQVWMFASPVVYPSSLLAEKWRLLYALNPMAGFVEGFRWALFGGQTAPWAMVGVSAAVAVTLLFTGAFYFRRMERTFADVV